MEEIELRENFEASVQGLATDKRFLAIVAYYEFIYKELLETYEFNNSRDALISTGHKVCLRELIAEIKRTMIITNHIEDVQW